MEKVHIRISSNDDGSIAVDCPKQFSVYHDESGDQKFVHITEVVPKTEQQTASYTNVTACQRDDGDVQRADDNTMEHDECLYDSNYLNSDSGGGLISHEIYDGNDNFEYIDYGSADFLQDMFEHESQDMQISIITNKEDDKISIPKTLYNQSNVEAFSSFQLVLPTTDQKPTFHEPKDRRSSTFHKELNVPETLSWGDRDVFRKWVFEVRKAVQLWIDQHHILVELKATQQLKEHQALKETIKRYQRELELSQQTILSLENDLRNCHEHHHTVEKQLNNQICFLQNWLQIVQQDPVKHQISRDDTIHLQEQRPAFSKIDCFPDSIRQVEEEPPKKQQLSMPENTLSLTPRPNTLSDTTKVSPSSCGTNLESTSTSRNINIGCCSSEHKAVTQIAEKSRQRYQRYTDSGSMIEVICFRNGSQKEIYPDGIVVIRFANGDIQTLGKDGSQAYYYAHYKTIEVKNCDCNIPVEYEFANGQKEQHFSDGTKIVHFPDGTTTTIQKSETNYLVGSTTGSSINDIRHIV